MQPTYVSLVKTFGAAERLSVPLFQRPYVWNREANWEPLWQDVSDLADRVLASPDKPVRGHFLGTVVLEQVSSHIGSIATREIIDGQQRLTTLQILLQAVRHALADVERRAVSAADELVAKGASDVRKRMGALTGNAGYDDEERYKVWPTNDDRAAFTQVMDAAEAADLTGSTSRMAAAHGFFFEEAARWLDRGPHLPRLLALDTALRDSLRLIVLDLDKSDEPQAIFETLNAHGTPLLPADLIKNWLLWQATGAGLGVQPLYEAHWRPFDSGHEFWRAEVGTGHAARARIDTFLQNWLTMRSRKVVPVKHLYDLFTARMDQERSERGVRDIPDVMRDIQANATRFHYVSQPTGRSRFDAFLERLQPMAVVVFHPFLLALMARSASDDLDRDRVGAILESYLVRRMICNLDTRGYGNLCIGLLDALGHADDTAPAGDAILAFLAQEDSKSVVWPDDELFRRDWLRRQFYGSIRRERVVMILRAIEERLQRHDARAEPVLHFDYSKLQIEHVMPQAWQEHWPVEGEEAAQRRGARVNTVGNLTLVSDKLNPSLSNAAWAATSPARPGKRHGLDQHSMLRLNADLIRRETWDERAIEERATSLFEIARGIWPSATTMRQARG